MNKTELKDFDNKPFKALSWLKDNPMKMVEYEDDGDNLKFLQRYNPDKDFVEYKKIAKVPSNNLKLPDEWVEDTDTSFCDIFKWKNIREYREEPQDKEQTQEQKIWSEDGTALRELKKDTTYFSGGVFWLWGNHKIDFERLKEGKVFRTKERAELERDRREVDYYMKKCACESNGTNEWRVDKTSENYYIKFDSERFYCECEVFAHKNKPYSTFNQAYFNTEKDAQDCLDKLIEKYTEPHLKKIWGLR